MIKSRNALRVRSNSGAQADKNLSRRAAADSEKMQGFDDHRNALPPSEITDGDLPHGWRWVRVDEVGKVQLGRQRAPKHQSGDHIRPYLRVANVFEDRIDLSDVLKMNFTPAEFRTFELKPGDILLNEGQSLHLVGRPALYRGELPGACFQNTLVRFRPGPLVEPKFALTIFRGYMHTGKFQKIARWTTNIAHLGASRFAAMPFPLPPVEDQRRIVAEIEKQFTRLDAGIASLKRVQAALKRYRASVYRTACEGRLVHTEAELARRESREYEPASELIARTPAPPRPNRWNSRSKDVISAHPALAVGNPETKLPEGWAWSALVEIAKMESGHTPSRNHPEWWDGDVAWIGIADAREYDGRTIFETFQHTNTEGLANSASRLLPAGTVCVSRTASVGYVVVMGRQMATSQDFVNWIPTPAITSAWLRIIFSADREALRRFGKGSVHKTIYFPEWLSTHVAVPPLAEQHRIVAEVDRRMSVIGELETVVVSNLQRVTGLRQSILAKAFRDDLVP